MRWVGRGEEEGEEEKRSGMCEFTMKMPCCDVRVLDISYNTSEKVQSKATSKGLWSPLEKQPSEMTL